MKRIKMDSGIYYSQEQELIIGSIELVEDNLFKWEIYLFGFDAESQIKADLEIFKEATGKDKVKLEVTFPFNYPLSPPFIRYGFSTSV